jgi:ABC-type transport system involved in multi-copper enzyme maturation permease subunit
MTKGVCLTFIWQYVLVLVGYGAIVIVAAAKLFKKRRINFRASR